MTENSSETRLDWLVDELVDRTAGARHAILLSTDGLLLAHSRSLAQGDGEHLAAVGSAYRSLSNGTGKHFGGGPVRQTVVEMEQAYLLVTEAGQGACLALLTSADADLGLVAYAMNSVVGRVGAHLGVAPRGPEQPSQARAS